MGYFTASWWDNDDDFFLASKLVGHYLRSAAVPFGKLDKFYHFYYLYHYQGLEKLAVCTVKWFLTIVSNADDGFSLVKCIAFILTHFAFMESHKFSQFLVITNKCRLD